MKHWPSYRFSSQDTVIFLYLPSSVHVNHHTSPLHLYCISLLKFQNLHIQCRQRINLCHIYLMNITLFFVGDCWFQFWLQTFLQQYGDYTETILKNHWIWNTLRPSWHLESDYYYAKPKKKPRSRDLNNYCKLALTSAIMNCFKRLVMAHISSGLPESLDPLQFLYCSNRSTTATISLALYSSPEHLDSKDIHVRLPFIDYSSIFNTIIPSKLTSKLLDQGLSTSFPSRSLTSWPIDHNLYG